MKVKNKTSFLAIAHGWHLLRGYGVDAYILPGETAEVNGPFIFEADDKLHEVLLTGEVTCHEAPDDGKGGYLLAQGKPVLVGGVVRGVTIRHYLDDVEQIKTKWRQCVTE